MSHATYTILDFVDLIIMCIICTCVSLYIKGAQAVDMFVSDFPVRVYDVDCVGIEDELFMCPLNLTLKGEEYSTCLKTAGVYCQGTFVIMHKGMPVNLAVKKYKSVC